MCLINDESVEREVGEGGRLGGDGLLTLPSDVEVHVPCPYGYGRPPTMGEPPRLSEAAPTSYIRAVACNMSYKIFRLQSHGDTSCIEFSGIQRMVVSHICHWQVVGGRFNT